MNYAGKDFPEQLHSAQVTAEYFRCLRAPVASGRVFTAEEDVPNGPRVAVLGYSFWTRRFQGKGQVIGRTITLDGQPYTVIGALGSSFDMPEFQPYFDVVVPFQLDPHSIGQGNYFEVTARLKPGVTLQQAKEQLQASTSAYRSRFPGALPPNAVFGVVPFQEVVGGNARSSLLVLECAVGFVLLIACANVANLLLVRAAGRRHEIGIRLAIGAGRGRVIRQLLIESGLLSLTGGALGLLAGFAGIRTLLLVNTAGLPRIGPDGSLVNVDWRVLAFTILISIATGIAFGLVPALQSSREGVSGLLTRGSGRAGAGFQQSRTLSLLVLSEVGLAAILLVGALLLIRTSVALGEVDPGFDARNVLTLRTSVTGPRFQTSARVEQMIDTGLHAVRAVPGVTAAGTTCCVPLQGGFGLPFRVAGQIQTAPMSGGWFAVSSGFFDVYRIPVFRGRSFDDGDNSQSPPVAIISEAAVRQFWKERDPLQDRIVIGRGLMREFQDEPERQIIGVARDTHFAGLAGPPLPAVYVPLGQVTDAASVLTLRQMPLAWVVRTGRTPASLGSQIQERLRQSTGLPVTDVQSMGAVVSFLTSRQRFNMLLMSVFGGCALALAAIGIYGVVAYSVEQRTREIGIRLALGAGPGRVRKRVVTQGLGLVLAGVAVGAGAASALTRFLANFLFGVRQHDPLVFTAVPVLLTAVTFFAIWLPARRAGKVDPMEALRHE